MKCCQLEIVIQRTPVCILQLRHPTSITIKEKKSTINSQLNNEANTPVNDQPEAKRSVIIAGDSIIQHVHGREISHENCNVAVNRFLEVK